MSLARGAAWMIGSFLLAAVLDYAFVTGMAWLMPEEKYGALSVALTFFLLMSFIVGSGFPTSLSKFLSERHPASRALTLYATGWNVALGLLTSLVFVALAFYGPLSPGPGHGRATLVVAASALVLAGASTLHYALQGTMGFRAFGALHLTKSAAKLVVGGALVALGFGVAGGLLGLLVGGLAVMAVAGVLAWRKLPKDTARLALPERLRFLRFTGSVFVGSLALVLLMNVDVLAVKYLTPRDASDATVAYYASASVLAKAHLWVVIAAIGVAFPVISRRASEEPEGAARLASRLLRWTVVGLLPVVAFLAVFPERALLLVFPPAYVASAPALSLSALAMGALAACFVLARALQATGRAAAPGMGLAVTAALQAALLVVLVPRYGIVGAAAATLAACVAGLAAAAFVACRAFHLRIRVKRIAAAALATGAFLLVVWAFPEGRFATVAALAAGCLIYAGLAWLTGLVTADERAVLLSYAPWTKPQEETG